MENKDNYKDLNKHTIKRIIKFVIATLSSPTTYLYKKPGELEFKFMKDIEKATKTMNREDADYIVKQYHYSTGDDRFELVVLPLLTEYSLIEE